MMGTWPLILDGAILVLLAATVFLAARLSIQLKNFRENRGAIESLVKELAAHIDRAGEAIAGLRASVEDAGRNVQGRIDEAQALADELQIILESGNRLAARIERLADENAKKRSADPSGSAVRRNQPAQPGPFAIRDREYEEGDVGVKLKEDGTFPDEDDDDTGGFGSRAEKELFQALQKNRTEDA